MSNYYLCDIDDTGTTGRIRRFETKEAAVAWAEQELVKAEVQGPAIIDVIHIRTGEVKTVARLSKQYVGAFN